MSKNRAGNTPEEIKRNSAALALSGKEVDGTYVKRD